MQRLQSMIRTSPAMGPSGLLRSAQLAQDPLPTVHQLAALPKDGSPFACLPHLAQQALLHTVATSLSRCLMTFLPLMRLMRCSRSLARWQLSLACPKGTSNAGAASIFSSVDATCMATLTMTGTNSLFSRCLPFLLLTGRCGFRTNPHGVTMHNPATVFREQRGAMTGWKRHQMLCSGK